MLFNSLCVYIVILNKVVTQTALTILHMSVCKNDNLPVQELWPGLLPRVIVCLKNQCCKQPEFSRQTR